MGTGIAILLSSVGKNEKKQAKLNNKSSGLRDSSNPLAKQSVLPQAERGGILTTDNPEVTIRGISHPVLGVPEVSLRDVTGRKPRYGVR